MALNRPYNIDIVAKTIDATEDNTVYWDISGDVQTAYQVDIYLNSDNSSVFSTGKITSYNLFYKIPKNTLTNGVEYKLTVTAFNAANESQTSDAIIFQTSGRPKVTIDTVDTISNYSNTFYATYTQTENVELQSYIVNLYNIQKELIDHSDIETELPMQYLFSNLETETSYYIEFQATSEKGLIGSSGLVKFDVFYLRPKLGVNLSATNIENGGMELSWYVIQVIGASSGTINYINNDEISLLNGSKVYFDKGFSIERDFSLKVWLQSVKSGVPLLTLKGDNGQLVLKYNAVQQSFYLTKTSNAISDNWQGESTTEYTFVSRYQPITLVEDKTVVLIQQINSDINISVTNYE